MTGAVFFIHDADSDASYKKSVKMFVWKDFHDTSKRVHSARGGLVHAKDYVFSLKLQSRMSFLSLL